MRLWLPGGCPLRWRCSGRSLEPPSVARAASRMCRISRPGRRGRGSCRQAPARTRPAQRRSPGWRWSPRISGRRGGSSLRQSSRRMRRGRWRSISSLSESHLNWAYDAVVLASVFFNFLMTYLVSSWSDKISSSSSWALSSILTYIMLFLNHNWQYCFDVCLQDSFFNDQITILPWIIMYSFASFQWRSGYELISHVCLWPTVFKKRA